MTDSNPNQPNAAGDGLNLPPEAPASYTPPTQPPAAGPQPPIDQPATPPTTPTGGFPPPAAPAGGYPPAQDGYQGYPPPGQAGYPPPPGANPPQPGAYPPPGYRPGPEPGGPVRPNGSYNLGEAFSYAWDRFGKTAGTFILLSLIVVGASVLVWGIASAFLFAALYSASSGATTGSMVAATMALLVTIVAALVGAVLSMAIYRAALDVTHGRPVSIGSSFRMDNFGAFVGLQVLVVVVSQVIGAVLGAVPGLGGLLAFVVSLAAGILNVYASMFLLDKGLGVVPAINAAVELLKANLGNALLAGLVAALVAAAGGLVIVGVIVTLPLAALLMAYSYRRFIGEPVV